MRILPSVIEKLQLAISPTWNKTNGHNSTDSKIKAKNVDGDIAGRDINKTYVMSKGLDQETPYVFITGAFGGNGDTMHFQLVNIDNTSNELIFLDEISFLDVRVSLNNKLIKPNTVSNLQTWDNLTYPTSNKNQWLKFRFHTRNGLKYVAKQKLLFTSRVADDKYNVGLDTKAEIIPQK